MNAFRYAMLFGVYGPLIAAAVIFGFVAPLEVAKGDVSDFLLALPRSLLYSFAIVPVALILGMVPGVLSGLMYWWLDTRTSVARLHVSAKAAIMAGVGGAVCVLCGLCVGAGVSEMLSRGSLGLFVAPGMAAAVFCTLLAHRRNRQLSPETSPERTREK